MTQLGSGRYRPGVTILHGLDTAVKLVSFVLLCVAVLFTDTWAGHLLNMFFALALVYLAQLKSSEALRSIRRVSWPLLAIVMLKFLFNAPDMAFYRLWIFSPSVEGLCSGVVTALRLSLILIFSDVLSYTSSPLKINEAIRTIVRPLGCIGLPAEHIALMLGLTVRFVPALFEEADNIRIAQKARGIVYGKNGFFDTARASTPMAVPLVMAAFRKAETLSMAMEARGYRMDGKGIVTAKICPTIGDWYALLVSAALFALQIIVL